MNNPTDDVPDFGQAQNTQHKPTHTYNHIIRGDFIYISGENTSSNSNK